MKTVRAFAGLILLGACSSQAANSEPDAASEISMDASEDGSVSDQRGEVEASALDAAVTQENVDCGVDIGLDGSVTDGGDPSDSGMLDTGVKDAGLNLTLLSHGTLTGGTTSWQRDECVNSLGTDGGATICPSGYAQSWTTSHLQYYCVKRDTRDVPFTIDMDLALDQANTAYLCLHSADPRGWTYGESKWQCLQLDAQGDGTYSYAYGYPAPLQSDLGPFFTTPWILARNSIDVNVSVSGSSVSATFSVNISSNDLGCGRFVGLHANGTASGTLVAAP